MHNNPIHSEVHELISNVLVARYSFWASTKLHCNSSHKGHEPFLLIDKSLTLCLSQIRPNTTDTPPSLLCHYLVQEHSRYKDLLD